MRSSVWRANGLPSRSRSNAWSAPTLSGSTSRRPTCSAPRACSIADGCAPSPSAGPAAGSLRPSPAFAARTRGAPTTTRRPTARRRWRGAAAGFGEPLERARESRSRAPPDRRRRARRPPRAGARSRAPAGEARRATARHRRGRPRADRSGPRRRAHARPPPVATRAHASRASAHTRPRRPRASTCRCPA